MQLNYRWKQVALSLTLASGVVLPMAWAQNHEAETLKPLVRIPITEQAKPVEATPQPAPAGLPEKPNPVVKHCNYTNQLDLTKTQRTRLKTARTNFVQDNQAAFDSLRIKRFLIKKLVKEKNPKNTRQIDQLNAEVQHELEALSQKKEATLQSILTPAQYAKMQTLKQQCNAQAQAQQAKLSASSKSKPSGEKQPDPKSNKPIQELPKKPL